MYVDRYRYIHIYRYIYGINLRLGKVQYRYVDIYTYRYIHRFRRCLRWPLPGLGTRYIDMKMMISTPPKDTSSHQDSAGHSPQRHTAAGTAAPTTTDTGNTVPQRANPTQTAYAHPRKRAQAQGRRFGLTQKACSCTSLTTGGLTRPLTLPST